MGGSEIFLVYEYKQYDRPPLYAGVSNEVYAWLKRHTAMQYAIYWISTRTYLTAEEFVSTFEESKSDQQARPARNEFAAISHPSYYNQYEGLEIIDLCEQMSFNRGNVVKYVARAGFKDPATELQDLMKARFYIEREIARLESQKDQ